MKACTFSGPNGENITEGEIPADMMEQAKKYHHELIGKAADHDDLVAEKFLNEEEPTKAELRAAIRKGTLALNLTPVFMGSAYKNRGVQKLLDGVAEYLPNPSEVINEGLDLDKNEEKVELSSEPDKPL